MRQSQAREKLRKIRLEGSEHMPASEHFDYGPDRKEPVTCAADDRSAEREVARGYGGFGELQAER